LPLGEAKVRYGHTGGYCHWQTILLNWQYYYNLEVLAPDLKSEIIIGTVQ